MEREIEIGRLLRAMVRNWWLILILACIGGGIGAYMAIYNSVPMYKADATLLVMNRDKLRTTGETLSNSDLDFSSQLVQDFSQIINSRVVTAEVIKRLKNSFVDENELQQMIGVEIQEDSSLLTIYAVSDDSVLSSQAANLTSEVFAEKMNELTNRNYVGILDKAQAPQYPMPNGNSKKLPLGIISGIILAAAIIFVRESFDTTIRSVEEIQEGLGIDVIGIIPEHAIK